MPKTESLETYGIPQPKGIAKNWYLAVLAIVANLLARAVESRAWNVEVTDVKGKYWDGAIVESNLSPQYVGRYLLGAVWSKSAAKLPDAFQVKFTPYVPIVAVPTVAPEVDRTFIGPVERTQDSACKRFFTRDLPSNDTPVARAETDDKTIDIPLLGTVLQQSRADIRRNKARERMAKNYAAEKAKMVERASTALSAMVDAAIAEEKAKHAIATYGLSGKQFARVGVSASPSSDMLTVPVASADMHALAATQAIPSVAMRAMLHCEVCDTFYVSTLAPKLCCEKKPIKATAMPTRRGYSYMAQAISGQLTELARASRAINRPSKADKQLERALNWRVLVADANLRRTLKSNPVYNVTSGIPYDGNAMRNACGLAPIQGLANARTDSPEISHSTYGAIACVGKGHKGLFVGLRSETVCRAKREVHNNPPMLADGTQWTAGLTERIQSGYEHAKAIRSEYKPVPLAWRELAAIPSTAPIHTTGLSLFAHGQDVRRFSVPYVSYEYIAANV
jgi:hypothetical protein